MKYTCIKKEFGNALTTVVTVIPSHHSLPILQCVLLTLKKDSLTLSGTNIEVSIKQICTVQGLKDGVVAVPSRVLTQVLNTIPDTARITCSIEDSVFLIESEQGVSRINSIAHTDFPSIPDIHHAEPIVFSKDIFIEGCKHVVASASKSLVKPELSGVYVYTDDAQVYFVASDSFRLAEKKIGVPHEVSFPDIIIPSTAVLNIIHILERNSSDDMSCSFEKEQAACICGDTYITFRVIDGTFPDYKAIIPNKTTTTVHILTEDLRTALKKAALFSDTFSQVGVHVVPQKESLTVSARNNTVGESLDSYPARIQGEELDINFNYRYLVEGLGIITSDSTELLFNGPGKPLIVHPLGDTSYTYLVMPMNR